MDQLQVLRDCQAARDQFLGIEELGADQPAKHGRRRPRLHWFEQDVVDQAGVS